MGDWRRSPGQGKYARTERERRFLVRGRPTAEGPARTIEDRYVHGTGLRLRRVTVGGEAVWKLTQKVRPRKDDPSAVALTNVYVDAEEYDVLSRLPAAVLSKTRRTCPVEGVPFVVDEFHGHLTGLWLAEVEVGTLGTALPTVAWLGREVSHDDRFSGGFLASAAPDQVRCLLAETRAERHEP